MHTTQAQAVPGAVVILEAGKLPDGVGFLAVPCIDFDAFDALPAAVRFADTVYGKTGWNSDHGRGYYRTDGALAFAVPAAS